MIAETNEKVVAHARCHNCRNELKGMQISTNQGHQAVYACTNESCPKCGLVTVYYLSPAGEKKQPLEESVKT